MRAASGRRCPQQQITAPSAGEAGADPSLQERSCSRRLAHAHAGSVNGPARGGCRREPSPRRPGGGREGPGPQDSREPSPAPSDPLDEPRLPKSAVAPSPSPRRPCRPADRKQPTISATPRTDMLRSANVAGGVGRPCTPAEPQAALPIPCVTDPASRVGRLSPPARTSPTGSRPRGCRRPAPLGSADPHSGASLRARLVSPNRRPP